MLSVKLTLVSEKYFLLELAHWQKGRLLVFAQTPGVCHAFDTIRKSCEPSTSVGIPITNRRIIAAPWQAIHFLSKVALLHFSSQTKADTLGNDRADKGAKCSPKWTTLSFLYQVFKPAFIQLTLLTIRQMPHGLKKTSGHKMVPNNYQRDYTSGQMDFLYPLFF